MHFKPFSNLFAATCCCYASSFTPLSAMETILTESLPDSGKFKHGFTKGTDGCLEVNSWKENVFFFKNNFYYYFFFCKLKLAFTKKKLLYLTFTCSKCNYLLMQHDLFPIETPVYCFGRSLWGFVLIVDYWLLKSVYLLSSFNDNSLMFQNNMSCQCQQDRSKLLFILKINQAITISIR